MNSRAFIFTLDAVLALIPVFLVVATVSQMGGAQVVSMQSQTISTHYSSGDLAAVLEKTGDVDKLGFMFTNYTNLYSLGENDMGDLERDNLLSYLNSSVLPMLAHHKGLKVEFWGIDPGNKEYLDTVFSTDNRSITGSSDRPWENESSAITASMILASGYEKEVLPSGYTARAWIEEVEIVKSSSYVFYGGFAGQGTDIRKNLTLPADITIPDNITEMTIETDTGYDFNLYINGNYVGFFEEGSAGGGFLRADQWTLSSGNFSFLHPGENEIWIESATGYQYVGGGYFKVDYLTHASTTGSNPPVMTDRYYFPWISGNRINHYSSFYVPGEIISMDIHLEGYFVDLGFTQTYLNIGNSTVFQASSTGHQVVDIDDATLSVQLDYHELSGITIPIRMRNGDYINYTSYIEYSYTPYSTSQSGEIEVTMESERFKEWSGDDIDFPDKEGRVYIPNGTRVVDARVTAYSSYYWADRAYINGNRVYWLGDYGDSYSPLGDPYNIHLPPSYFNKGEYNYVRTGTGSNPSTPRGGSPDNRIIFTLGLPSQVPFGQAFKEAGTGFNITLYYDSDQDLIWDGTLVLPVSGGGPIVTFSDLDPSTRAVDDAFLRLMDSFNFMGDLNEDGYGTYVNASCCFDGMQQNPIDLKLGDVKLETEDIGDVPFMWGPVRMVFRVWE